MALGRLFFFRFLLCLSRSFTKTKFALFLPEPEQYAMSLAELYEKALRKQLPIGSLPSPSDYFRQFYQVQSDSKETVKDSIHLDWIPVRSDCPECGLNARLWDGFGHRPLWNQTWWDAVAFQPLATRSVMRTSWMTSIPSL